MNINEMSDQEKSVMLARLCGWLVNKTVNTPIGETEMIFWTAPETKERYLPYFPNEFTWEAQAAELVRNLYNPANMALAWRVLNWAGLDLGGINNRIEFHEWFYSQGYDAPLWECLEPANAQRAWLDKILSLAIEAGMVTK